MSNYCCTFLVFSLHIQLNMLTTFHPTKDEGGLSINRTIMTMSPASRLDAAFSDNRMAVPDRRHFAGYPIQYYNVVGKSTANIGQPWWVQQAEAQDNRHMTLVKLLFLGTGRLYLQEIFLVLAVKGWDYASEIVLPTGLCERKIPMTPSGIDPANLPGPSTVPQSTATSRGPMLQQTKDTTNSEFTKFFIKLSTTENIASLNTDVGASRAVDLSHFQLPL